MASLVGQLLKNIYRGFIITSDNNIITSTPKNITDGSGNSSALSLGTNSIIVSGSLSVTSGITGSLQGTASFALSASYAPGGSSFPFSGSAVITGSLTVTNGITGSLRGTASFATSTITASFATSAVTASFANNFTVAGTITAQKLVVQTITSSILYSSGSNIFGNDISNTQIITGSLYQTGSLASFMGKVGINTDTPAGYLDVRSTAGDFTTPLINLTTMAGGAPADEIIQSSYGVLAGLKRMNGKYAYGNDVLLIGAFDGNSNFTGNLGIGLSGFEIPQAALDIKSTTKGFLMPRMTTADVLNLMPVTGSKVYNTTINAFQYYNGSQWQTVGTTNYKVFTALLTQSGTDGTLENNDLNIGTAYKITDNQGLSGWDFTNVGAPNNNVGTVFTATGTTPNDWTNGYLIFGMPVITVLENTLGDVSSIPGVEGVYYLKSANLFTINKTTILNGSGFNLNTYETGLVETAFYDASTIQIQSYRGGMLENDMLNKTTIEIRVYN